MEQSESLYRPCHPSEKVREGMTPRQNFNPSTKRGKIHFFFFLDSLLPPTSSLVILQPQDLNKTKMQFCRESCNLMQRQLY